MTLPGASDPATPTHPDYVVRDAVPGDAPTIVEFNRRLAWETEAKALDLDVLTPGVLALFENRSRGRYFVAEHDGAVVGQIMLTYEWSDWRNGVIWWVQSVYVAAEHRRRGVLRRLFDHIHATAASDPEVCGLRLYVEHKNHAAQAAYRKYGFADAPYFVMERWAAPRDPQ